MSGLFISPIDSRQLCYYFVRLSSGGEDCRTHLDPDEVDFFGPWQSGGGDLLSPLSSAHQELQNLKRDPRFLRPIRNLGYDLCFVAPKQVSILFGLLPTHLSNEIVHSHKAAVSKAIVLVATKTGWGTSCDLSAVGFVHQTSRELDPHLHTHLVVANRIEIAGGSLRALDSTSLFAGVAELSKVYRIHLAQEIYNRLGIVMIERDLNEVGGPTEIPGFPPELAEVFSKRARQVSDLMSAWGATSLRARRQASLITRPDKVVLDSDSLRKRWEEQLASLNFSKAQLMELIPNSMEHIRGFGVLTQRLCQESETAAFLSRIRTPRRGQGLVRVVTYGDDVFDRLRTFSMGRVVAAVSGDRQVSFENKSDRLGLEGIDTPVEIIVSGRFSLERVAALASRYSHQNLFIAVSERSWRLNEKCIDLPFERSRDFAGFGRSIAEREFYLGSGVFAKVADCHAGSLAEMIEVLSNEWLGYELGSESPMRLVFGSKTDRTLVLKEIANVMGVRREASGFYDGEPILIRYLPKRYMLKESCGGQMFTQEGVIKYLHDGRLEEVPISAVDLKTMVTSQLVVSPADAQRATGRILPCAIEPGSFACIVGSLGPITFYVARNCGLAVSLEARRLHHRGLEVGLIEGEGIAWPLSGKAVDQRSL